MAATMHNHRRAAAAASSATGGEESTHKRNGILSDVRDAFASLVDSRLMTAHMPRSITPRANSASSETLGGSSDGDGSVLREEKNIRTSSMSIGSYGSFVNTADEDSDRSSGCIVYKFSHQLMRDAAYALLTKAQRETMHATIALGMEDATPRPSSRTTSRTTLRTKTTAPAPQSSSPSFSSRTTPPSIDDSLLGEDESSPPASTTTTTISGGASTALGKQLVGEKELRTQLAKTTEEKEMLEQTSAKESQRAMQMDADKARAEARDAVAAGGGSSASLSPASSSRSFGAAGSKDSLGAGIHSSHYQLAGQWRRAGRPDKAWKHYRAAAEAAFTVGAFPGRVGTFHHLTFC
jgi:hypothetical protein